MHLRAGNTKSCGKASCRPRATGLKPRTLAPTGPRALSLLHVQRAWASYTSDDTSKQRSVAQLAKRHRVPARTLYDIFRTVQDVGGIDDYIALVSKE